MPLTYGRVGRNDRNWLHWKVWMMVKDFASVCHDWGHGLTRGKDFNVCVARVGKTLQSPTRMGGPVWQGLLAPAPGHLGLAEGAEFAAQGWPFCPKPQLHSSK